MRNQRGFSTVAVLAIIVVLVVIGAVGYRVYKNNSGQSKKVATEPIKSLDTVIADVKSTVLKDFAQVKVNEVPQSEFAGNVHYKVDGYSYNVTADSYAHHVTFLLKDSAFDKAQKTDSDGLQESEYSAARQADTESLRPVNEQIQSMLQAQSFTEDTSFPVQKLYSPDAKVFVRNDSVCYVSTGLSAALDCVTRDDLAKVAKDVKPFVEAYYAKINKNADSEESFGLLETGTGTGDAKYALMSTGNAGAYFYQKDGKWEYYISTQEGIGCEGTQKIPEAAAAFSQICRKPGEGL